METPPFLAGPRKIEPGASADEILSTSAAATDAAPEAPSSEPAREVVPHVVSPQAIAALVEQGISLATTIMARKLPSATIEEIASLDAVERELILQASILSADWLGPHLPGGKAAAVALACIAGVAIFTRGRKVRAALEKARASETAAPPSSPPSEPASVNGTETKVRATPDGTVSITPPRFRPMPSSSPGRVT